MKKTQSNSFTDKDLTQIPQSFQNGKQNDDDTIDLYDLWITLWDKRWFVIGVTALSAILSVVFALSRPPIYKAEALLHPPKLKDVQSLNVQVVLSTLIGDKKSLYWNLKGIDADSIFSSFGKKLSSRILQKKFIKKFELMELLVPERNPEIRDEDIYEEFSELIKVSRNGDTLSLSIELFDPNIAAQWVNDYVKFVDRETINTAVENMRNNITNQIRDIEYTIASKRQMAKKRREDKILRYSEAVLIASSLGVKERVDTTTVVQNNQLNISTSTTPLYYRGTKALNMEIEILKRRKSDDPFILRLRDLQERLALLRSIKFNTEEIYSMNIDQAAYPPINRIKPNRRMITTIGTIAGCFIAIFMVFFVSFVKNQREVHSYNKTLTQEAVVSPS